MDIREGGDQLCQSVRRRGRRRKPRKQNTSRVPARAIEEASSQRI